MPHTLTLDIPDEVYQPIFENAQRAGRTPEEVASAWLASAARVLTQDPLLRWAGAFAADLTDIADRHDYYLGQALLKELRGNADG